MHNNLIILGVETSCDETGIGIYNNKLGVLSEYVYSQTIHYKYGGTVPELASRDHIKRLMNLIIYTCKKKNLILNNINAVSYVKGPGLNGPLLIGASFSRSLGYSLRIPTIGINHLESHILISFMFNKNIKFPCLVILASGAHTMLINMKNYKTFSFMGGTLDDGVGEAFDKIARFLKLIPPNGLSIEKMSNILTKFKHIKLSKALLKSGCYNLSFSGLKTEVIRKVGKFEKYNIAYNFQNTIIKILVNKCINIITKNQIKGILLVGGVASNKELRLSFLNMADSIKLKTYTIPTKYCTDNGTMIAFLGFLKSLENKFDKNLYLHIKLNKKNYLT